MSDSTWPGIIIHLIVKCNKNTVYIESDFCVRCASCISIDSRKLTFFARDISVCLVKLPPDDDAKENCYSAKNYMVTLSPRLKSHIYLRGHVARVTSRLRTWIINITINTLKKINELLCPPEVEMRFTTLGCPRASPPSPFGALDPSPLWPATQSARVSVWHQLWSKLYAYINICTYLENAEYPPSCGPLPVLTSLPADK